MMKPVFTNALLLTVTALLTGCQQYGPGAGFGGGRAAAQQSQAAAEAEDHRMTMEREQRLNSRIQDLEMEIGRIDRMIAQ